MKYYLLLIILCQRLCLSPSVIFCGMYYTHDSSVTFTDRSKLPIFLAEDFVFSEPKQNTYRTWLSHKVQIVPQIERISAHVHVPTVAQYGLQRTAIP